MSELPAGQENAPVNYYLKPENIWQDMSAGKAELGSTTEEISEEVEKRRSDLIEKIKSGDCMLFVGKSFDHISVQLSDPNDEEEFSSDIGLAIREEGRFLEANLFHDKLVASFREAKRLFTPDAAYHLMNCGMGGDQKHLGRWKDKWPPSESQYPKVYQARRSDGWTGLELKRSAKNKDVALLVETKDIWLEQKTSGKPQIVKGAEGENMVRVTTSRLRPWKCVQIRMAREGRDVVRGDNRTAYFNAMLIIGPTDEANKSILDSIKERRGTQDPAQSFDDVKNAQQDYNYSDYMQALLRDAHFFTRVIQDYIPEAFQNDKGNFLPDIDSIRPDQGNMFLALHDAGFYYPAENN